MSISESDLAVVESYVSAHLARRWQADTIDNKTDTASHPAAVLSDGEFAVFVKVGEGPLAADRFRQEAHGLHLLSEQAGVLTPETLGIVETEGGAALLLEAVREITRDDAHYRQMGRALAQVHSTKGLRFGLDSYCYWGDLYQDNTPATDWPTFFWERRLAPRLKAALDSGNLPAGFVGEIEQLGARLPALCGPAVAPALLHGDAHKNNCLATPRGPLFIDPSVYYGHPEMDLAYVDFFEPVPDEVFAGYAEVAPLNPGFWERRNLWRLPALLAMVEFIGAEYLDKLDAAVRHYR